VDRLSYVFTIFFITLGPLKTIPVFFELARNADRSAVRRLALRSTLVATAICLFIALVIRGLLEKWRTSLEALQIAGGVLLFVMAARAIMQFSLREEPPPAIDQGQAVQGGGGTGGGALPAPAPPGWLSRPVLSPLAVPTIVTPIGVVAILLFMSIGGLRFTAGVLVLLLVTMALNLLGMLLARPIMKFVGLPTIQVLGWIVLVLQAGLAVQVILGALRRLQVIS
jgi:multiple antibiotic resistance protein